MKQIKYLPKSIREHLRDAHPKSIIIAFPFITKDGQVIPAGENKELMRGPGHTVRLQNFGDSHRWVSISAPSRLELIPPQFDTAHEAITTISAEGYTPCIVKSYSILLEVAHVLDTYGWDYPLENFEEEELTVLSSREDGDYIDVTEVGKSIQGPVVSIMATGHVWLWDSYNSAWFILSDPELGAEYKSAQAAFEKSLRSRAKIYKLDDADELLKFLKSREQI